MGVWGSFGAFFRGPRRVLRSFGRIWGNLRRFMGSFVWACRVWAGFGEVLGLFGAVLRWFWGEIWRLLEFWGDLEHFGSALGQF